MQDFFYGKQWGRAIKITTHQVRLNVSSSPIYKTTKRSDRHYPSLQDYGLESDYDSYAILS